MRFSPREGLQWKARSGWALRGCRTWNGKPGPEFFRGHAQITTILKLLVFAILFCNLAAYFTSRELLAMYIYIPVAGKQVCFLFCGKRAR